MRREDRSSISTYPLSDLGWTVTFCPSSHIAAKATKAQGGISKHDEMLQKNHTPENCAGLLRVFAKVHDENCCDVDRLALSLSTKRAASAVKESRNASLHPAPPAPRS